MKVITPEIDQLLVPITSYFKKDSFTHKEVNENPPLRSELFSKEQMDLHAQHLALNHTISNRESPELLLKGLSENEEILYQVNELLKKSVHEKKSISPAAEWLLDNFYLIEEQIRIGKRYLPKGYSKGLPKLNNGLPRVYDLAIEIISHSDGHIDIHTLGHFITSYQKESELTLGELWAIPIMLRLALLENLSRVAARIAVDRKDSALANKWARQIIETAEKNPKDLVLIIADMARSEPPMVSAFVAEFVRKLQWKGPELSLPLNWVEQHLSGSEDTINSMVLIENQKQAANQVSVSNSINSLRLLAKMDWREFVETMSVVEEVLQNDAAGAYAKMDFYTRDQYRHKVEEIAKKSGLRESEVASTAVELGAKHLSANPGDLRRAHVGYYLLKSGITLTEKIAKVKLTFIQKLKRQIDRDASKLYSLVTFLITASLTSVLVFEAYENNISTVWIVVILILGLLCTSQLALAITNWLATIVINPKPLPKLDFSTGIPNNSRTIVVVPTLLTSPSQIETLVEELEVRYLANRDPNLLFGLLTDFRDSPSAEIPEDQALIRLVQQRIIDLNKQYDRLTNDTFFLFHRPREWNIVDKIWMGYERKRGKLTEFNQLLRGNGKDRFSVIVGEESSYTSVKYVITLDTDTQLPRDAAWKLVWVNGSSIESAAVR